MSVQNEWEVWLSREDAEASKWSDHYHTHFETVFKAEARLKQPKTLLDQLQLLYFIESLCFCDLSSSNYLKG